MRVLLVVISLVFTACGAPQGTTVKTNMASLLTTPERFAGKRVELEVILLIDFEVMVALDPSHLDRGAVWFDYADYPSSEHERRGFPALKSAFEQCTKKDAAPFRMSARARVVGVFEHSKERRFGHLGHFQSKLSLEEILEAAPYEEKPNEAPAKQD